MIENMTKKDLEERMVVETREGNRYLVCGNSIIRNRGYCNFSDYTENLTSKFSQLDIVKVYDVVGTLEDMADPNLPLIWERKRTPEVGDIYLDDTDGEKFIIIAIDKTATYPYTTMNIYKNSYESNIYTELELQDYKFIGTDANIAKRFYEAFAILKDYKS